MSAGNYDSVIQAAVRFHRPDLAWELYVEMRDQELLPSTDTVTDLIYRCVTVTDIIYRCVTVTDLIYRCVLLSLISYTGVCYCH